MKYLMSFALCLCLISCGPPPKDSSGNTIPPISVNNGVTRIVYFNRIYFSCEPQNFDGWFDENGCPVASDGGVNLSKTWRRLQSQIPSENGRGVIDKFNAIMPEED